MTRFQANLTVAPNGRVVIPAQMRAELGLQAGGKLIARLVDGAVVLEPADAAVRRAQALIGRHIPQGTNLSDELIRERHAQSAQE